MPCRTKADHMRLAQIPVVKPVLAAGIAVDIPAAQPSGGCLRVGLDRRQCGDRGVVLLIERVQRSTELNRSVGDERIEQPEVMTELGAHKVLQGAVARTSRWPRSTIAAQFLEHLILFGLVATTLDELHHHKAGQHHRR